MGLEFNFHKNMSQLLREEGGLAGGFQTPFTHTFSVSILLALKVLVSIS